LLEAHAGNQGKGFAVACVHARLACQDCEVWHIKDIGEVALSCEYANIQAAAIWKLHNIYVSDVCSVHTMYLYEKCNKACNVCHKHLFLPGVPSATAGAYFSLRRHASFFVVGKEQV
jgi:hypothetical protein